MDEQSTHGWFENSVWRGVLAIVAVLIGGAIAIKIYTTPFSLSLEFSDLLSLVLALFSVGLSTMFYFKATETSNNFYDNTYKFTKDIAELLVKIESGFGEKLRNIDQTQTYMREYLQNMPTRSQSPGGGGEVERTKERVENDEKRFGAVLEERNKLIKDLVARTNLQQTQQDEVLSKLASKDEELHILRAEINSLQNRLKREQSGRKLSRSIPEPDEPISRFTLDRVVRRLGSKTILDMRPSAVPDTFEAIRHDLPEGYIEDLARMGLCDDTRLNMRGVRYLRMLAEFDLAH